jgi:protein AATF/BFR2
LVERTQVKRTETKILGTNAPPTEAERNPEIFDDLDFYQTILKEIVSGANPNSIEFSDLWGNKNKLKSKRKQTKGSKGRMLRYQKHDKLVAFMAPTSSQFQERIMDREKLFQNLFA